VLDLSSISCVVFPVPEMSAGISKLGIRSQISPVPPVVPPVKLADASSA